jgi:hypothetical protein
MIHTLKINSKYWKMNEKQRFVGLTPREEKDIFCTKGIAKKGLQKTSS